MFSGMALNTLERRDVPEIYGMFERFVGLMAGFAFAIGEAAEIDRMPERSDLRILSRLSGRIKDDRVADIAIVTDNLTCIADVFAVVAAEAA